MYIYIYIYICHRILFSKRKEIGPLVIRWMNLENIFLGAINQARPRKTNLQEMLFLQIGARSTVHTLASFRLSPGSAGLSSRSGTERSTSSSCAGQCS
jgi:hypothetical protein